MNCLVEVQKSGGGEDEINLEEPLLSAAQDHQEAPQSATTNDDDDDDFRDIVFPSWISRCCCRCCFRTSQEQTSSTTSYRLNHNVALNLLLCVLYGISDSLWGGTVFAGYLKRLGRGRNTPVGNVEAANGLAGLLSALPVGCLADRVGRARIVRAGGVLLLATAAAHASLLTWIGGDDDAAARRRRGALVGLTVVMVLWGVAGGIVNGPAQALYADSTPAGERSKYYTYLFAAYVLSSCVGPLISILLFQTVGDDWNLYDLRAVLYVGLALEGVNAFVMMFFDDRKALDEGGGGGNNENHGMRSPGATSEDAAQHDDEERANTALTPAMQSSNTVRDDRPPQVNGTLARRRRLIPYITFLQGLIFAIGSGMTVKFFPLFFKDDVGLSPSHVQVIYVIIPIVMTTLSSLGQKLASTGFGRVQAALVLRTVGVSLLFLMVFGWKGFLDRHPMVLVCVYILRTSFINSTYPLDESVLMDFVPKDERARWKSLESVAAFGWCGSAAVGGWIADKYDYRYTFLVTAILQSIATAIGALLIPLVPRKEGGSLEERFARASDDECGQGDNDHSGSAPNGTEDRDKETRSETMSTAVESADPLREPLLQQEEL
jgi:MFS family permease